ncbi:hypothetical protein ACHWQZ_G001498 [Mnemiopsis leidyi]
MLQRRRENRKGDIHRLKGIVCSMESGDLKEQFMSENWLDKKKNETTYWKCADFRKGCGAPITTLDDKLTSPAPDHSHDSVFQAKQSLKRKAAQAYLPTKFPCSGEAWMYTRLSWKDG